MITNLVVTAYCACQICCGKHATGLTASGQAPTQGITVAASRRLPFGTKMTIAGHTYTVQDRLAKRFDSRVDIYFANHADARKFGIHTLAVTLP